MKCPKCNVEMKIGYAISTIPLKGAIVYCEEVITAAKLKIVECLKCPLCGYSNDGVNPNKLEGYKNNNDLH